MKKVSLIAFVILLLYSCNGHIKKKEVKNKQVSSDENRIVYHIDFPDTVFSKEENYGLVSYKSHYDTIISNFGVKDTNRYVRLITTITNDIDYDYNHLKNIVKDTFGAYDNRSIYFMLKFENSGVFYMDGVINDLVLIDMYKKEEKEIDKVRWLEDEIRVTKKVIVIDKK